MDLDLRDKVVLITGGSKGLGLASAILFAQEGARVAIASRDSSNLAAAEALIADEGHSVTALQVDLSDPTAATGMVAATERVLGPIDVLVNSAGATRRAQPEEITERHWRAAMDAKYFPYLNAIDAVLPGMVRHGSGSIVNIVGAGGKMASPTHLTGGGANAALMLVTAGLAQAYAPKGIRVNAVNPGLTHTERLKHSMMAEATRAEITPEEALRRAEELAPLRRLAQPEEVANVVVFLASGRASYVTGAIVALDGAATPTVV